MGPPLAAGIRNATGRGTSAAFSRRSADQGCLGEVNESGKCVAIGRRDSFVRSPTGVDLLRQLCKRDVEEYQNTHRIGDRPMVYVPFESARIIEPSIENQDVDMLAAMSEDASIFSPR